MALLIADDNDDDDENLKKRIVKIKMMVKKDKNKCVN